MLDQFFQMQDAFIFSKNRIGFPFIMVEIDFWAEVFCSQQIQDVAAIGQYMADHPIQAVAPEGELDQTFLVSEIFGLHFDDFYVSGVKISQVLNADHGRSFVLGRIYPFFALRADNPLVRSMNSSIEMAPMLSPINSRGRSSSFRKRTQDLPTS